nr:hypothetical protein [Actinomycetota bacterium]
MGARTVLVRALLVSFVVVGVVGTPAPSGASQAPDSEASGALSSPDRIQRAIASGALTRERGYLYIAYALLAPDRLPRIYRSDVPFHGTVWLLELRRVVQTLPAGPERAELERLLTPDPGSFCDVLSPTPLPDQIQSPHFYIEYDATLIGGNSGLTIQDYIDSLEGSWTTEVDNFGWAAPPVFEVPPPGGKYHVRIEPTMAPILYGFVSSSGKYAGPVGNNPNTAWNDQDADASCMGLNNDYSNFPGTPQRALDATTAHEFNHSIQFGYGALSGANAPDSVFVEGGATWMEDEVYDYSNDNYNYLWPTFENDMGEYEDSPYPYWITWRGLTERYGAGISGGGEDVMQRSWEITSRNEGSNLEAMNSALAPEGTTLAAAYHAYAVAVKFNKACGGGYVYPYCFEEGPQYVNGDGVQPGAGETQPHGTIESQGGSFSGSIPDNYSLNWVVIPETGPYRVTLTNTSTGGAFKGSLICDTGRGLRVRPLRAVVGAGETTSRRMFRGTCVSAVAVISNQAQTAPNPP